ncbi:putative ATP-grasp target RiPP [Saccharopolyspora antimicrobica]|uniref:ATP-grasp target RiPP n=1 Tax=Saccharopolyspora antimicrobica TaxID=455193 RepID=A0A1I5I9H1_9PSEU|nr:putative ATP-grasp-modified RiPP [Saccharopolyspora antimicrobica]RKT85587.1 putative ATP-grasp target RiPP [Saccharopolyspora antimicrobica]SFO57258.1 putative ATP-grasp target RiPP [Saccharopolyspora antimicrobica]
MTTFIDDPLASASGRFAGSPGTGGELVEVGTNESLRPFGLRVTQDRPLPVRPEFGYCHEQQVAIDPDGSGVPLVERMDKDWKTKGSSDGDEGPEEHYDWEEL